MRHSVPVLAAALAVLLPVSTTLAEDVLVLKNGREIRGEVLDRTEKRIQVRIAGGSVWYPLDRVAEVRENVGAGDGQRAETVRTEHALLYSDGRRVGTRVLRTVPRDDGMQWEEHVVFLGEDGSPALDVRTIERCDERFLPVMFQVQETDAHGTTTLHRGEAVGTILTVTTTVDGEAEKSVSDLKPGTRFPFGAREAFLRGEGVAAGERVPVFDFRDRRWRWVTYEDGGERVVEDESGRAVPIRVVVRRKDNLREIEWIEPGGRARLADLNGVAMRAHAAEPGVVAAVAAGEPDRVTGIDSAARTLYQDVALGYAIRKPDPSWLFEAPRNPAGGALLVVRNRPLGASVDVLRDTSPAEGVTLEAAGDALLQVLRAHSEDLEVNGRDLHEDDPGGYLALDVTATTKGERTRTLAHVRLGRGGVYRLLAACPADRFELARPEMEEILLSFRTDLAAPSPK